MHSNSTQNVEKPCIDCLYSMSRNQADITESMHRRSDQFADAGNLQRLLLKSVEREFE